MQAAELAKLRAAADAGKKEVDAALLERYTSIKKRASPPMALLSGDLCGGCNMSLPQAVLRKIKAGADVVECENCGRILFVRQG